MSSRVGRPCARRGRSAGSEKGHHFHRAERGLALVRRRHGPARRPGDLTPPVLGVSFLRAIWLLPTRLTALLLRGTVSLVVQQTLPSLDLNFHRAGNVA